MKCPTSIWAGYWSAAVLASVGLIYVAASAEARTLDLEDPNDVILVEQKLNCSLTEGEPIVYWWQGSAYSRVPGEKDRHLFNVEGTNMRACKNFEDKERGRGYRSVSREVLLYKDPETNEILRTWVNPWTEEEVEVMHVANDPVNMRQPSYARSADGEGRTFNATIVGNRVFTTGEAPLFYNNPLAGEYQDYVGNKYHAMEALNSYVYKDDLLDSTKAKLEKYVLSWARFSEWLPWMKMRGRTGMMIFSTVGGRVDSYDDLPDGLKAEIDANYPIYKEPPPIDDDRPNVTSWGDFKTQMESRRAKSGAGEGGME
ncbi:MAG: DUF1838 domain-containing protein [Alphaproteobacteria bacterium]|nr:DUF1838 domain-containing protein [Alphaproteobacteria bacterium]